MDFRSCIILLFSAFTLLANAQPVPTSFPSSWPQVYPGMPAGNYSPAWQSYFQVTENLPNVAWPLSRNWAGNIPVQRAGHPNDTLFFWAFESSNGSFTADNNEPWGIWLNGGPGASSLVGLFFENGPINIASNYSAFENTYAWSTVADYVWVDQPVGVGYSTADSSGYVPSEDQLGADFMGFLENLVKVFPNLATRPLYLTGESYAGTYIPYITKAYFGMENPPVNLAKIAIGDGTLASIETVEQVPVVAVLETYPQIIGYDPEVFAHFREQSDLCGYNLTLQYPQPQPFPPITPLSVTRGGENSREKLTKQGFMKELQNRYTAQLSQGKGSLTKRERIQARDSWKRSLAPNGTIDPFYGCDIYNEMLQHALKYTFPWSSSHGFNVYDVPDALSPEANKDAAPFLNDPQTRAALHAPTSKNWSEFIPSTFAANSVASPFNDPSPPPMTFLSELATNATAHNMSIVIYSGNDDTLVSHFGSQVAIQNTTFGGIRGFTRKPDTPWYNDAGEFAGIVHQERGWTYVLIAHAGHLVGNNNPVSALTFIREFVLGNNQTGLVTKTNSGAVSVVGGEVSSLSDEILRGQAGIYYGHGTTASTYFFPTATVDAWNAYIATATATSGARSRSLVSGVSWMSEVIVAGSVLVMVFIMV